MANLRTRFAPSPTGYMHVGGARTALFGWLVASRSGGQFILRIEDTDKSREVSGSIDHIIESLSWLGIKWDEGPDKLGEFGPYKQSERLKTYKEWAEKLVEKGRAYPDPYTPEQVEDYRKQAAEAKRPFLYRDHRPETTGKWDGSKPLRFKSEPKSYAWHDEVLGDLKTGPEVIDDFIIIKSDGYPTYNFAHIIDDHLMGITLVIRSQEFIASVPKFLNLYEALDFKQPNLATLPYVMGASGNKKLGKRDGAKDILDYAKEGYLPEAMVNFLASLGWNDGTEKEIFTVKELVEKFDLSRVQRSPARFDEDRLIWMNGAHIRALSIDELFKLAKDYWPVEAKGTDDQYRQSVLELIQERLKFLSELADLTRFFFTDLPIDDHLISSNKLLNTIGPEVLKGLLVNSRSELSKIDFSVESLKNCLNNLLESQDQKPAVLFSLIRIATTESPASPSLAETMSLLGKETCLKRIDNLIQHL
ncbi:MAG TPA: glutamate--tRNA ligase [Candidatus Saccharimonadales bacterium]|nr:glutamate--tRNA ligase [Candidatus Saccharimonadales bacterium]